LTRGEPLIRHRGETTLLLEIRPRHVLRQHALGVEKRGVDADGVEDDVDDVGIALDEIDLDGKKLPPVPIMAAAAIAVGAIVGAGMWMVSDDPSPGATIEAGVPWVSVDLPDRMRAGNASGGKAEKPESQIIDVPATGVASVSRKAYLPIPEASTVRPLSSVPDAGLVEQGVNGPLPMVGADGREPWKVYARPAIPAGDRPQVVIIMTGLGLSAVATEAAIKRLPPSVTLAFDPYGKELDDWVPLARRTGHEFLLTVPMEPIDFPIIDPGPYALESILAPAENLRRLNFIFSRVNGYVGVLGGSKSFFTTEEDKIRPVLQAIKSRGLLYVDSGATAEGLADGIASEIKLPRLTNDLIVDLDPSTESIDKQLVRLEEISRRRTIAVGIATPYPVTVARLVAWAATLESKNMVLSPVSAVADVR